MASETILGPSYGIFSTSESKSLGTLLEAFQPFLHGRLIL